MKLISAFFVVFGVLASSATAQSVFGNENGCMRFSRQVETSDDAVLWVQGDRIEFYASSCTIDNIHQLTPVIGSVGLTCRNEEDGVSTLNYIFDGTDYPERYVIYPDNDPDFKTVLRSCE